MNDKMITVADMVVIMTVIIYVVDVMQDHSSSHDPQEPAGRESTETPV